jgi:hypothetical protein
MTRLTKDIRDEIVMDLLRHSFKDRIEALYAERSALAQKIYEDAFSADARKKMQALPDGWLPEVNSINVRLGSDYTSFEFSGGLYGDINRIMKCKQPESRRIPFKFRGGCVASYEATHSLALEHERIGNLRKSLWEEIESAKRAATTAVNAVSTVKRLIEVWPEVDPFASKHSTEKPQLPAVPTAQLNKILGLPVEELSA